MKYRPYKGFGAKAYLYYHLRRRANDPSYPRRTRTKHDWHWFFQPSLHDHSHLCRWHNYDEYEDCRRCMKTHCYLCGCQQHWKRWQHNSNESIYQKRLLHRQFRLIAKRLIRAELGGDDAISHGFWVTGRYID